MYSANTKLKDFYQSELAALRQEALAFAQQHPEMGQLLGLNQRQARDPQVELLLQSFAFLAGRLQYQAEVSQAESANALLNSLYPHLAAPVPSMLIAELTPKPSGSNLGKEQVLERGRGVYAAATNQHGKNIPCRFRTAYTTPLLPLEVSEVESQSVEAYPFLRHDKKAASVLRVRLRCKGVNNLSGQGRIHFFINPAEPHAYALYDMLALHLDSLVMLVPQKKGQSEAPAPRPISIDCFRWLGEREDEAMLPSNPQTHPGYRLLQEYFSLPEKFMFFEVSQINFNEVFDHFDLLFVLDANSKQNLTFKPAVLRLNCVPLINLFSQRLDPLALDHSQYEYHLLGDLENHRHCEIYAIEMLESIRPQGTPREIAPYFALDQADRLEQQDYFYVTRRTASLGANIAGSELFVSFLDQQFNQAQLVDEVIGGKALCTNRRLAEQILCGTTLYLEGAGAVTKITAMSKPTPHQSPAIIGARPWSLVSQLSLNHLSLADGELALSALKDILRLHLGPNPNHGMRQIDSILSVRCRPTTRHRHQDGWRGFVRGHDIRLQMDQYGFEDHSAVLFCAVLRHFLRSYASVNQLVEVSLEMNQLSGVQKQWQAFTGVQTVL